jgi:hypothetical protein
MWGRGGERRSGRLGFGRGSKEQESNLDLTQKACIAVSLA